MSDLDRILKLAGQAPQSPAPAEEVATEREMKPVAQEAAGEFSEPLYALQDELGLEDNILVDELARWMDGQDITEFVKTFRQNHEMPEGGVEEAKAKPDYIDIDKDGNKKEPMKKAIKDKKRES